MPHENKGDSGTGSRFRILGRVAHHYGIFSAHAFGKNRGDHFLFRLIVGRARIWSDDRFEAIKDLLVFENPVSYAPRLIGNSEESMAAITQRSKDLVSVGVTQSFSPAFGVVTGSEGPFECIQLSFLENIACAGQNLSNRGSNEPPQVSRRNRKLARAERLTNREFDSWQRVHNRAIEVEQHATRDSVDHSRFSLNMLEASSSGERKGYMSSRFGVRIFPSG